MISVYNNSPSFTSVMPVKVRVDGKEAYSEYFMHPACRKLSAILFGPTKDTETKNLEIIKTFAKHDPDYNYNDGLFGHKGEKAGRKPNPSDFFRYISRNFENFFMTGNQAKTLKKYGKQVGNERYAGRVQNVDNELDLMVARSNYWGSIKNFINNKSLRLRENFDEKTGKKSGEQIALVIDLLSNKKYGQSNFKMDIEKISFEKV